jgi:hypothetical protein
MGTEEEMRRRSIARMQEEEMVGDGEAERRMDDGSVSTVEAFVKGFGEMERGLERGRSFPSKLQGNFESLFLNSSVVDELELELLG